MLSIDNTEKRHPKRKCCLMGTRLFLSAILTVALSAFTIIYNVQQDYRDRLHRKQDQQDLEKLRKQLIYDTYLDDIGKHLLSRVNESAQKTKLHIRAKTLNALLHLDTHQKSELVLFLYENYLIRSDHPDLMIDLSTANLIGCEFTRPCNLNYLYLPGVLADHITFNQCKLRKAIFTGSSMVGAKFLNSHASGSQFDEVNLTNAIFIQTNNLKANFANAILVRSSFVNGPNPQGVNFLNTDLLQSDLTDKQLRFKHLLDMNLLLNTRFPNGSFSDIDRSELIIDGSAEMSCSAHKEEIYWNTIPPFPTVLIMNASTLNNMPSPIEGQCYFQCPLNDSELYQSISVRNFSVLIDSGLGQFNISAYFSCPFLLSSAYVQVGFYTEDLLYSGARPVTIESKKEWNFHFNVSTNKIPERTRFIYISVGANTVSENISTAYCLVDDIRFNFFKSKS